MADEKQAGLLRDILDSAEAIRDYPAGVSREAFFNNREKQDAVLRRFEIIGEAASRLSAETHALFPGVPFRSMRGMRNIIAHDSRRGGFGLGVEDRDGGYSGLDLRAGGSFRVTRLRQPGIATRRPGRARHLPSKNATGGAGLREPRKVASLHAALLEVASLDAAILKPSKIEVQGARYPEKLEAMTGR